MKRRILLLLLTTVFLTGCTTPPETICSTHSTLSTRHTALSTSAQTAPPSAEPVDLHEAVYLGVESYNELSRNGMENFVHLFYQDGTILRLKIRADTAFSLQNQLMEGCIYLLEQEDGLLHGAEPVTSTTVPIPTGQSAYLIATAPGGAKVTLIQPEAGTTVYAVGKNYYLLPTVSPYFPPVAGVPGVKTLKNLLATAMMPLGITLYVYGGGWNWQDDGASLQATTIGLPQSWVQFFQGQDAAYHYNSYFPHGGWNQYYYAGADCSGYLGWVVYNTLHTISGGEGYVGPSTKMAADLARRGLGNLVTGSMLPGDILSMQGHVYLCLGTCPDGSVVILHSTPNTTGGAGVQLSALGHSRECQAWQLANFYMNHYFPQWAERYGDQVLCLSPAAYAPTGHFRFTLLEDPENLQNATPEQVLAALFGG